jgi:predicted nucleotidyltransferase
VDKDLLIKKLTAYFSDQDDIDIVYLFGSVAKGKERGSSDVDIAVLFSEGMPLLEKFERKLEIAGELEEMLGTEADVIDLEEADIYFVRQVMLNKKLLIDKNVHRRVKFEVNSRRIFFDMKPFYDMYHEQALKRLERE